MNLQRLLIQIAGYIAAFSALIAVLSGFEHIAWIRAARSNYYKYLKLAVRVFAALSGLAFGVGISAYKPIVDLSNPQPIKIVYRNSEAIPSNAIPAEAIPSNAIPAEAIPSNAIPAEIMSRGIKAQRLPDFAEKVCGSGRCDENTKYIYYSDQAGEELAGPFGANEAGEETAGPSPAAPDSISVEFYADAYTLTQGECTNLHWDATGSKNVWINETSSDISGVKEVCPVGSTTYLIVAAGMEGTKISSSLVVQVQAAVAESKPGVETAAPDRCELFNDINMSVTYLDWTSGAPLQFYFKMPGGVPGLGKNIAGDTGAWNYSAQIGSYPSSNCNIIQGYEDRLYCTVSLPSDYSSSMRPLTLNVNDCESPIYSVETAFLPEIVGGGGGSTAGVGNSDSGGGETSGGGDPGSEIGGPAGSCSSDLSPTSCAVYGGTYVTPFCTTSPCLPSFCACP